MNMLTSEQRKADICKVIKSFLLFRPESTSKDIIQFLGEHDFGLNSNRNITPHKLTRLIQYKSQEHNCHWFNVEMIKTPGKPVRWRVIE